MLNAILSVGGLKGVGRWFVGDWLLENGFYRPISSASLTLDYTLYGEQAWGFCLTNWLLLWAITFGSAFLVPRLLRVSPSWGWGVAIAISMQYTGLARLLAHYSTWWWVACVAIGVLWWARIRFSEAPKQILRHWWAGRWWLFLAIGALFWGFDRWLSAEYVRLIEWVPSRTALLGSAFGVWAVVCFLHGLDTQRGRWLVLGGALYLLALGSYEQPIMLAPFLLAVAFVRRKQDAVSSARLVGSVLACVLLIMALRMTLVTTEPTLYQRQQLRSSLSGPVLTYLFELVPPANQWLYWQTVGLEPMVWFFKQPWDHLVALLLFAGVAIAFYRWRVRFAYSVGWHALTFLPMAFLHFFEHYMILPQVGKTLTDCLLIGWGTGQLVALASTRVGYDLDNGSGTHAPRV